MLRSSDIAFEQKNKPAIREILSRRQAVVKPLDGYQINSQSSRLTFFVPPSSTEYLSSKILFHFIFSLENPDGSDLAAGANVAFSAGPSMSAFSDVQLSISGTVIEGLEALSFVRSYVKAILGLSNLSKETFARDLYKLYLDTPFQCQSLNPALNVGFGERRALTAGSAWTTVIAPIPFDLSQSQLAFPSGSEIKISMQNRSNAERLLSDVANANFRIRVEDVSLIVEYLTLSEASLLSLRHRLSSGPLWYPYLQTSVRGPLTIAAGVRESDLLILRGELPELCLVGIQPANRLNADFTRNAYDWRPNALQFIQLSCNGTFYPNAGWTLDAGAERGTHAVYNAFLEVMAALSGDNNCVMSYQQFVGGFFWVPFPLRAYLPSPAYATERQVGDLRCKVRFELAPAQPMSVFVFCVTSSKIGINQSRRVVIDSLMTT